MLPPSSSCSPGGRDAGERELGIRRGREWGGGWLEALFTPDGAHERGGSGERQCMLLLEEPRWLVGVALPPGKGDYRCPDHYQPMSPAHSPLCVDSHVPKGVRIMTFYNAIHTYYIICFFFSVLLTFNT